MRKFLVLLALPALLLLSGCNVIYKLNVQQGNILDQEMIDSLEPGMTKRQVLLTLGSPAIENPFRHDRWDYVASLQRGEEDEFSHQRLTVHFEGGKLTKIEGDYKPGGSAIP